MKSTAIHVASNDARVSSCRASRVALSAMKGEDEVEDEMGDDEKEEMV